MYGYDATYGPSFSSETPSGSGLGAYCNGSQFVSDGGVIAGEILPDRE